MFVIELIFWISLYLIVYAYVLYPLLLLLINRGFQTRHPSESEQLPRVSIIIAAYNEEKMIQQRIENCLALDYPKERLEVIIASDGSTDQTNDIVGRYVSQGVTLKVFEKRSGKVNVLNATIPEAKYDIIVFSDANTFFKKDAIRKLVRSFDDPKVGCVCGALSLINKQDNKTGEMEGIYWRYESFMKRVEGRWGTLLGANGAIYAIHKDLFEKCPEDTIVEDFYIPMRILAKGFKVIYDDEAVAYEESAAKIIQEKQRRIRIGAGDFQALFRLLPMLDPSRGFSALAFWSHKVLRWFAPFFLILVFVSNGLLLNDQLFLNIFILQCVFYMCAFIGQMLSWSGLHNKLFSLCYYFVSMNLALLLGFVRYITGNQAVTWKRTER